MQIDFIVWRYQTGNISDNTCKSCLKQCIKMLKEVQLMGQSCIKSAKSIRLCTIVPCDGFDNMICNDFATIGIRTCFGEDCNNCGLSVCVIKIMSYIVLI